MPHNSPAAASTILEYLLHAYRPGTHPSNSPGRCLTALTASWMFAVLAAADTGRSVTPATGAAATAAATSASSTPLLRLAARLAKPDAGSAAQIRSRDCSHCSSSCSSLQKSQCDNTSSCTQHQQQRCEVYMNMLPTLRY